MVSFLLFAAIFLLVLAIFAFFVGGDAIVDPFADHKQLIVGFVLLLLVGPGVLTGAWNANEYRANYRPALDPIAAPELAEAFATVEVIPPSNALESSAVVPPSETLISRITYLNAENERLANELSLKTTALTTASETILTLQNRVKVLESTRIIAPAPTTTPIATPPTTATTPPCRNGQCRRPGCN